MEENLKWESYVVDQKIDVNQLSEKVKNKIHVFEETYKKYEEADENDETLIRDLEAELHARDEGIYSDLTSYVAERDKAAQKQQQNSNSNQELGNGGKTEESTGSQSGESANKPTNKPSWRFWM